MAVYVDLVFLFNCLADAAALYIKIGRASCRERV